MSTDTEPDVFQDADGWSDEPAAFSVTDDDSASWVLGKFAEADAEVLKRAALLTAATENLKANLRRAEARRAYLEFRFGPSLTEYARTHLAGKARTWHSPTGQGRVEFRRTAGTNRIRDMDAAVAFVEGVAPEFVRVTKSVTVSDALTALRELEVGFIEPVWLESTGAGEKVSITTGITSK